MKLTTRSARAPPYSPLVRYQNGTKIKKLKSEGGKVGICFSQCTLFQQYSLGGFYPFLPEMCKIIAKSNV